jgi:DNA invertase Pin-like site-specific DNA recombinase
LDWVTRDALTAHNLRNPAILQKKMPLRTKNYKLSIAQVLLIKQMLRTGKNRIKMIAKQFGITSTQVNRIKNGSNWKQVHLK